VLWDRRGDKPQRASRRVGDGAQGGVDERLRDGSGELWLHAGRAAGVGDEGGVSDAEGK
jgi:hypothetical protein